MARRVKMLKTAASPKGIYMAGEIVVLSEEDASAYISGGCALELSGSGNELEAAIVPEMPENATKPISILKPRRSKVGD